MMAPAIDQVGGNFAVSRVQVDGLRGWRALGEDPGKVVVLISSSLGAAFAQIWASVLSSTTALVYLFMHMVTLVTMCQYGAQQAPGTTAGEQAAREAQEPRVDEASRKDEDVVVATALSSPAEAAVVATSLSSSAEAAQGSFSADLNLVTTVVGLEGLKAALASKFNMPDLPESFRCGFIVDLNQHWVSVHALFQRATTSTVSKSSLSLIVFDTLEVNYQHYYNVGLLRSSEAERKLRSAQDASLDEDIDVCTLCEMRGVQYNISFLAPINDMRRLTWEEEDEIRTDKRGRQGNVTIYYDRHGNPFRKIIVQPILQAERDGTCKSRALAALGWLLNLDDKAMAWYVKSAREMFQVELQTKRFAGGCDEFFGSLMSSGQRDKFGRQRHMKVCHSETLRYNHFLQQGCSSTTRARCLDQNGESGAPAVVRLPVDCKEEQLRSKRQEELGRIREVSDSVSQAPQAAQKWREIGDHEERWRFLEETCFFGHNLGFRKIPKKYSAEEILGKSADPQPCASEGDAMCQKAYGFEDTQYIRKYRCGQYVTHEADPLFQEPLENVLAFLCAEEPQTTHLPFYVLPFPDSFTALSLEDHVKDTGLVIELEGDHRRQRVSDFIIPQNSFLNEPCRYNKTSTELCLPMKLS